MILAALLLIAWCGYELAVRADDWSAWTGGVRHLSRVRGESYLKNLFIMAQDPGMRAMMRHMLLLVLGVFTGVFSILFRNRKGACVFILICCSSLAAGFALAGVWSFSALIPAYAKMLPLLLLAAGTVYKLIRFMGMKKNQGYRRKQHGNF